MNHQSCTRSLLFAIWLIAPVALPGQSVATTSALDLYRDSLQVLVTVDQVRSVERRAVSQLRPSDAISLLRLGFALLRRAQVEDGKYFDRARNVFQRAEELEPAWHYPPLGVGLAEGGKGDWLAGEPLNIGTRVGHGAYRSAVRALVRATEKDPYLTAAIIEMDRGANSLRDTTVDRQVLAAVRAAVAAGNDHPTTLLILGRRERAAGGAQASISSLKRYLATGLNPPLAGLEIARTLLTEGNEEGVELYFNAATTEDSATIAELRADLIPIAETSELARFDSLTGTDRVHFLQQFWNDRARRDLRSPAERLREHYRRLQFARQYFVLSNNRRFYGLRDLYRAPRSEVLDDRGVVYVRHGEPDTRLRPVMFGLLPNETWLYQRPDGDLLLHFSGGGDDVEGGDLTDYRLVPSIFALRGSRVPKDMVIASRFEVSDIYQKIMSWGPHGAGRVMRKEQEWGERSAVVSTETDAFALRFSHRLDGSTDVVTIGRRGTHSLLQVIYALPGIEPGSPVRFRLSLFDSAGSVRSWQDTVAPSVAIGTGGSGGRFELPAPSGTWYYRFALEAGDAGVVVPMDSIVIPDLHGAEFSISGIGLGRAGSHIAWITSQGDTALLSPGGDYETDSDLQLYFEIYGLEAGTPVTASVRLLEKRGKNRGRSRLQFTFQEEGQGVVSRIRRTIRLSGLKPGGYWLEVELRDANDRRVTARKELRVIPVAQ